eukprot:CAMPEP_0197841312 /NCGR_PEP_ID=MMETSP1437-20131217/46103_1 /TAXON_ID=49252 ORGANISM="Eucampia antarctica, Strain CCMP1452" /NCGR_SAMPLE_ID=MMETSP1437 /ASSEMBLY_ACC=CAM_ASM_001096 /LENGTH=53 /DNA_ID=CAMNT_0043451039 /DNA_START=324 /DNA_END=485 /DNA_ORIENTATION=+
MATQEIVAQADTQLHAESNIFVPLAQTWLDRKMSDPQSPSAKQIHVPQSITAD